MGYYNTPRRFYLRKAANAFTQGLCGLGAAWRAKQLEQPGIDLPADFPYLSQLITAGYVAVEDLDGADVIELVRVAHLVGHEADRVLAAAAALIGPQP